MAAAQREMSTAAHCLPSGEPICQSEALAQEPRPASVTDIDARDGLEVVSGEGPFTL